jgi:collagenase-like PrtC family protease
MSKLLVTPSSYEHLNELLEKEINGVIISIKKLSVNSSFYIDVDELNKIDFKEKEVFVSLNKLMHNSDLDNLREVMAYLKDKEVKIIFYDMALYNIARELDMVNKLVIHQDHLNASTMSNSFYYDLGIHSSYITSDITKDELLEIKKNSKMDIMFLGYGYAPIFYSRRYLITNYLDYINEDAGNEYEIKSDTGVVYPISEEEYGTTIYSPEAINLINYLDEIKDIDYLVLDSNKIEVKEFNNIVDKFINKEKMDNVYVGFFNTKTIYKVK